MLADRTKKWKAGFMLIVLMMVCVGSGGCGNSSSKDPLQDPTAVTTPDGEVIRYGDTQESVEEILGMEITGGMSTSRNMKTEQRLFTVKKTGNTIWHIFISGNPLILPIRESELEITGKRSGKN